MDCKFNQRRTESMLAGSVVAINTRRGDRWEEGVGGGGARGRGG